MEDERKAVRFTFIFDAYIHIQADTEDEARDKLLDAEQAVEKSGHTLEVFQAYGVTDNKTGDEIREVH